MCLRLILKRLLVLPAILSWLLAVQTAIAQPSFRFEHISTEQGLSQISVWSICQDREGFMWFGTLDGLNKFDGYQFTVFKPNPEDPTHSFRHNIISVLHEDRKGRLWAGTYGGGLHLVDKRTGQVTSYPIGSISDASLNTIMQLCEDKNGMIWVSVLNGLVQFNPETRKYKRIQLPYTPLSLQVDTLGRIWYRAQGKFHRMDLKTAKTDTFPTPSINPSIGYIDTKGIYWMGTNGNGLFWADTHTDSLQLKPYDLKGTTDSSTSIFRIFGDPKGILWLSTNQGLLRIDQATKSVLKIPSVPWQRYGLGEGIPFRAMRTDQAGNLWVGGYNGIYKLSAQDKPFKSYQVVPTPSSVQVDNNRITSLLEDRTGTIWAAHTSTDITGFSTKIGFYRLKPPYNQALLTQVDSKASTNYHYNGVEGLCEDHKGQIWIGAYGALYQYNRSRNLFDRIETGGFVENIKEDRNGKLWFFLYADEEVGIASYDPISHKITKYLTKPYTQASKTSIKGARMFNLFISRNNDIWIAYAGDGLARLNQRTGKFRYYEASPTLQPGRLNDKDTRVIYEDANGIIWVGTNQGGLNRLDTTTGQFTQFTTRHGLPSNHIVSIIGDRHGNLWLGTNNGICRFNAHTRQAYTFTVSDGLPDNECTIGTAQERAGRLLFGTLNGFVMFNPDSVQSNRTIPPVYITSLKVLDKPRVLTSDHIELPYSDNYLSLEFVALNYNSPEKNQYAYQLEGVDKDWVHSGTRRFVNYTELSPGDYTFRVKASNNDGIWNEKGKVLFITINPPWWRTWWAYLLYGLLLVGSIRGFITYRSRALRRENRLLEEKVALRTNQVQQQKEEIETQRDYLEETLNDLKATQTQLIQKEKLASLGELTAGIAHEIQNPLNFVNNFSEVSAELIDELKEGPFQKLPDSEKEYADEILGDLTSNLKKINHHGGRASSIVKGMLEHSRTESGEKRPTDLNALADEYLKLAYHGLKAKDKSFTCQLVTDFDTTLERVEVAPQEIGRVLLNLYNNAFYAVHERAKQSSDLDYKPTVEVCTQRQENQVMIQVRDNGTGIPDSVKAKIFQPFFTTKPTGEGTGLGLSLSYDIITKGHGGTITVESAPMQGTIFSIYLPSSSIRQVN